MRRGIVGSALLAVLLFAPAAQAQIGIAARAGTTGVGGDVAFSLGKLALRGGMGVFPFKPSGTFSDVKYDVDLPSPIITAGVDFYPTGGGFRLMGGVMLGADKTEITGVFTGTANIGGQQYSGSELGDLLGVIETASAAPYFGIGFGRHTGRGMGLTLDLGLALMGESTVSLSASGGSCQANAQCNAELQQRLREEEAQVQEDVDKVGKLFPIISLGLRIGLGS